MSNVTQIARIRQHLLGGKSITTMSAIIVYGCTRLAAVIEDLRREGLEIDTIMKRDESGKKYAEYRLHKTITEKAPVQVRLGHGRGLPTWVRKCRNGVVKVIHQDVAYVEFTRGTVYQTHPLNLKELVAA